MGELVRSFSKRTKKSAPKTQVTSSSSVLDEVEKTSGGGSGGSKSKARGKNSSRSNGKNEEVDDTPLEPGPLLAALAKAKQEEAQSIAAQAETYSLSTFDRRLGNALLKERSKWSWFSSRSKEGGGKANVANLLREMDDNGDGVIQKIELKKFVRNKIKLAADNQEIDAFFDSIDTDRGGTIDLNELIGAVQRLQEAAQDAKDEEAERVQAADDLQALSEQCTLAAEHMAAIEELEMASSRPATPQPTEGEEQQAPFGERLGRAIATRKLKANELVAKWDPKESGTMTAADLTKRLTQLLGVSPSSAEIEELASEVLKGVPGSRTDDPLPVKRVAKVCTDYGQKAKEKADELKAKLNKLRAVARKEQRAIRMQLPNQTFGHASEGAADTDGSAEAAEVAELQLMISSGLQSARR